MNANVAYSGNNNFLAIRLMDHARLGLSPTIQNHEKNTLEKIGDAGLWPIENLPRMTWKLVSDPRVITIAATGLTMLADSFLFYNEETTYALKAIRAFLPTIPFWALKVSTYTSTMLLIGSVGARAEGRFMNKNLMDQFYGNQQ